MSRASAALLALAMGCTSGDVGPDRASSANTALRVSAHGALDSLTALTFQSSSAAFLDLVYVPARKSFDNLEARPTGWYLHARAGQSPSASELRHRDLVKAVDVPGGVEVILSSSQTPALDDFVLDTGPYQQASYSEGRITLRRRTPGVPQIIEIVGMPTEDEEWRRFLAREVDVLPTLLPGQLRHLSEIPSVRVAYMSEASTTALHFRADGGPFADREARRRVSRGLRRRALAFATGETDTAAVATESPSEHVPGPNIRLIVHASQSDRLALVLEEQLLELGYSVTIKSYDVADVVDAVSKREFELIMLTGGYAKRYFGRAGTGLAENVTGYSNAEFDAAVEAGDDARAIAILEQDVPFTPLFVVRDAAAADRRFCGVHPKVSYDLSWLADVHPCAPGETQ